MPWKGSKMCANGRWAYGVAFPISLLAVILVCCGCGDGGGSTVPSAPTQVFAVDAPVMVFGVGVDGADGYRLYQSTDGSSWTQDPSSAIILDGDPDFYPSRCFGFVTSNSTTDVYYKVCAYNANGESADSPTMHAEVVSDFTTSAFLITSPSDSASGVSTSPSLAWNSPGSVLGYFVHIEYGSTESWDYFVSANSHQFGSTVGLVCGKYGPALPAGEALTMTVTAIDFDRWGNRESDTVGFTTEL